MAAVLVYQDGRGSTATKANVRSGAQHGRVLTDLVVYDRAASDRHDRALFALLERELKNAPKKS